MLWFLLVVGIAAFAFFLFAPRRLQTLENVPEVVDEKFQAHGIIETIEDPREVRPMALAAAKAAGDRPAPGRGESLTRDWPQDPSKELGSTPWDGKQVAPGQEMTQHGGAQPLPNLQAAKNGGQDAPRPASEDPERIF